MTLSFNKTAVSFHDICYTVDMPAEHEKWVLSRVCASLPPPLACLTSLPSAACLATLQV